MKLLSDFTKSDVLDTIWDWAGAIYPICHYKITDPSELPSVSDEYKTLKQDIPYLGGLLIISNKALCPGLTMQLYRNWGMILESTFPIGNEYVKYTFQHKWYNEWNEK